VMLTQEQQTKLLGALNDALSNSTAWNLDGVTNHMLAVLSSETLENIASSTDIPTSKILSAITHRSTGGAPSLLTQLSIRLDLGNTGLGATLIRNGVSPDLRFSVAKSVWEFSSTFGTPDNAIDDVCEDRRVLDFGGVTTHFF